MVISTIENCVREYRTFDGWDAEYDIKREQFLASFANSVTVEGDYSELDMAVNWCLANLGPADIGSTWRHVEDSAGICLEIAVVENGQWANQWFYKTSYDCGFMEFYFKTSADLEWFAGAVPSFFGVGPKGKWKTEGCGNVVYL
jgi:hypothetical protein